jgi:hypothetical protein
VTEEMLKKVRETPAEGRVAAIRAIAAGMSDLEGLYDGVLTIDSLRYKDAPPAPATITSVDVQGDRATAHVVANVDGQPFHADVELRRYADGWKVDDSRHYKAY